MITTVANHKGGSTKTTTTQSLALLYGLNNKKVLLIDLDPQKNLSLIFNRLNTDLNIFDLLNGTSDITQVIYHTDYKNIDIIGGSKTIDNLNVSDVYVLKNKIDIIKNNYDLILIDTPPHLNLITQLSLIASDNVLIPLQASIFDIQGLIDIKSFIDNQIKPYNNNFYIRGLLLVKYTHRFIINRDIEKEVQKVANLLNTKVYKTSIRESSQMIKSQAIKSHPLIDSPNCNLSEDYKRLYKEVIKDV